VLTDWIAESGNFWIEAATDCLRAIGDGMISFYRRYTNVNSYTQI